MSQKDQEHSAAAAALQATIDTYAASIATLEREIADATHQVRSHKGLVMVVLSSCVLHVCVLTCCAVVPPLCRRCAVGLYVEHPSLT